MENTLLMQKKRVLFIFFLTYGCLIAGAHAAESLQQEGEKKGMALMMSHTLLLKDITAHFLLLQFSLRPPIQTHFVIRNERILELHQVFKAGWLLGYVLWLLHFLDSAGKICSLWVWCPDTWTKTLFYRGLVFFTFYVAVWQSPLSLSWPAMWSGVEGAWRPAGRAQTSGPGEDRSWPDRAGQTGHCWRRHWGEIFVSPGGKVTWHGFHILELWSD